MIRPPQTLARPEYVADERMGFETANDYIVLQRLKIIQKAAEGATLAKFGVGDLVLMPSGILVAPMDRGQQAGTPFIVIPLFFFASWAKTNDIKAKGKESMLLDYSIDPKSQLAAKAKNRATWEEPHPKNPEWKVRNIEQLNFVIIIDKDELRNSPAVIQFAKSGWYDGSNWLSRLRNINANIWSRRWEVQANSRASKGFDWIGVDVRDPVELETPWVSKDEYEVFKAKHLELKKQHTDKGLQAAEAENEAGEAEAAPTASQY
jgi:hypothetical protein